MASGGSISTEPTGGGGKAGVKVGNTEGGPPSMTGCSMPGAPPPDCTGGQPGAVGVPLVMARCTIRF
jgi:hypothetical protein